MSRTLEIIEKRFGKIESCLLEEFAAGRLTVSQLFERVASHNGKGKSYCSGNGEGEIIPVKLSNSHGRSVRPSGETGRGFFTLPETEPYRKNSIARQTNPGGRDYRVSIGEILRAKQKP
jgi:hypothetical protein